MDVAFDIETIANRAMIERLPEPDVKVGNLKDPSKIAEKIADAKAEQVDKMALSPLYGRVCAFVAVEDANTVWQECIEKETDAEEIRIIEAIFRTFIGAGRKIITFNGNGFDLPFVYRRAVMLGVDIRGFGAPTLAEMTARYGNLHHVDLMQIWCGYGMYEKLDNLAKALFDDQKIEIDFHTFPELIQTPDGRKQLLDYCRQDVNITLKLWNRIAGILI